MVMVREVRGHSFEPKTFPDHALNPPTEKHGAWILLAA